MSPITIILFFVYSWGLGFTITSFVKNSRDFFERQLMRIGIGLGVFSILGVFLNLLHIPLDWRIFLLLSVIYPFWVILKNLGKKENNYKPLNFNLKKLKLNILLLLVIFFICTYMYIGGSFQYPYLEDDDPWDHAIGVKYVSEEKTAYNAEKYDFQYMDPYPPAYGILMGVLFQTSTSIVWVLKFFNGLILSLGMIFFYFFVYRLTGSKNRALFSTFIIASLPSFFTHFIWAHSLAVILFFPAMYCLQMIKEDKKWIWVSIFAIAAIFLTQPTQAFKIGIMIALYFLTICICQRKFVKEVFFAGLGGFALSFLWWGRALKGMIGKSMEIASTKYGQDVSGSFITKFLSLLAPNSGTATRAYTFNDFFIAKPFGGINVHIGWGIFVTILVILGIFYLAFKYRKLLKDENSWLLLTLVWFIFTFLGTNSMTFNLPMGLYAFRFWLLLAIPVALLCSLGLSFLYGLGKGLKVPKLLILIIIVIGIISTSGYQKFNHNMLPSWPPGVSWTSMDELNGYMWMKDNLNPGSRVFSISEQSAESIIGSDMDTCPWCQQDISFRKNALNKDSLDLYNFLKRNNYQFFVLDGMTYRFIGREYGVNETNEKLSLLTNQILSDNRFFVKYQTKGMVLFGVI